MIKKFQLDFQIGAIKIRILSNAELHVSSCLKAFESNGSDPDVTISVSASMNFPTFPDGYLAHDLMMEYYSDNTYFYSFNRGAKERVYACRYKPDFSEASVYLNERAYPGMIRNVDKILQLFPMPQLLYQNDAMILHSSRIIAENKSIVFTAPSQTGKTTQARLWHDYEHADIVSNDRTLLRRIHSKYFTYGYPVDGSSPVCDSGQYELGAIVILQQSDENRIEKISLPKKLKYLMEQTVVDKWNIEEFSGMELLYMDLIETYPMYLLKCRPDQDAVLCLKQQLITDRILTMEEKHG